MRDLGAFAGILAVCAFAALIVTGPSIALGVGVHVADWPRWSFFLGFPFTVGLGWWLLFRVCR